MAINLSPRSRFRFSQPIIVNGVETYGKWTPPPFMVDGVDPSKVQSFLVTNGVEGRPDLIANTVYGDPRLDWVIIAFNNPLDVLNWPKVGQLIRYPLASVVLPQIL